MPTRSARPTDGLGISRAVGASGPAAVARGLGCARRRLVGDVVERTAPRWARRRSAITLHPSEKRRQAVRHPAAQRAARTRHRGFGLDARDPGPDRNWVPRDFTSLGTDGWGISDTRGGARRHFLVDAESITVANAGNVGRRGEFDPGRVRQAMVDYQLNDPTAADPGNTEGAG